MGLKTLAVTFGIALATIAVLNKTGLSKMVTG